MTLYALHRGQPLTLFERPDDTWAARCKPGAKGAIDIRIRDTVALTDKQGRPKAFLEVAAFVPRIQYGKYTRSGTIVASYVEWVE